ncbi:MAG: hypothetical protein ACKESB_03415 [Candidatus Hodgkinia cicadicola]
MVKKEEKYKKKRKDARRWGPSPPLSLSSLAVSPLAASAALCGPLLPSPFSLLS